MRSSNDPDNDNALEPTHSAAQWKAQGWSDTPEELSAATKLEAMISVRFDADAAASIRKAARLQGMSRSEFVRRAALSEANRIAREVDRRPIIIKRIAQVFEPVITGDTDAAQPQSTANPLERSREYQADDEKLTGTE